MQNCKWFGDVKKLNNIQNARLNVFVNVTVENFAFQTGFNAVVVPELLLCRLQCNSKSGMVSLCVNPRPRFAIVILWGCVRVDFLRFMEFRVSCVICVFVIIIFGDFQISETKKREYGHRSVKYLSRETSLLRIQIHQYRFFEIFVAVIFGIVDVV